MSAAVRRSLDGSCVAIVALVIGVRPLGAQTATGADDLLARPVSPGTIALLVEHWSLVRSWSDAQPLNRAATANAIEVFSARLVAAEQAKQPTHALLFGRELLSRASGARPVRSGSWNESLRRNPSLEATGWQGAS